MAPSRHGVSPETQAKASPSVPACAGARARTALLRLLVPLLFLIPFRPPGDDSALPGSEPTGHNSALGTYAPTGHNSALGTYAPTGHHPTFGTYAPTRNSLAFRLPAARIAGISRQASAWFIATASAQPIDPASLGFIVESIEVLPATVECEVLVRRNLGFAAGDRVPPTTLIESKERLEATGIFREVDVHTRRGQEPGAIVVVVEVEIGRRIHFEAGIGQEDFSGWYLNMLGLRWTSPLHRGGTARIGLHSGLEMSGLFATLELPEVPTPEFDGLLDLASFERTWYAHDGQDEYRQSLVQSRILVGARKRSSPNVTTTFWFGGMTVNPADSLQTARGDTEIEVPASTILPAPERTRFREARVLLEKDERAPVDPWRHGRVSGVQLRLVDQVEKGGFWSVEGDTRAFLPVLERSALALRLQAGYTSPGTPYHQRFRLGGTRHLRGYTSSRLSGPLGAEAVWIGSAEFRHPLLGAERPQPRVLGTLFADIGNHWDSDGRRGSLSAGVGYGLQIQIPWIQVVTWEVSYPITDEPSVDAVVATLTLGRSF